MCLKNILNLNLAVVFITILVVLVESQVDFDKNIWLEDTMSLISHGYQLAVPVNNTYPVYVVSNDDEAEASKYACYDMFTMASLHELRPSCELLSVCRQGPIFESKFLLLKPNSDQLNLHKDRDQYKQIDERICSLYEANVLNRKSFHKETIRTNADFYSTRYRVKENFAYWMLKSYTLDIVNPEEVCSKDCSDINVGEKFESCLAFNYLVATEEKSSRLCYLLISKSIDRSMIGFADYNLMVRSKLNIDYFELENSTQGDLYTSYITDPIHTDFIEISREDLKKFDMKAANIFDANLGYCGQRCNYLGDSCAFTVTWIHPRLRTSKCSTVSLNDERDEESIEELASILSSFDESQYRILAKKNYENFKFNPLKAN